MAVGLLTAVSAWLGTTQAHAQSLPDAAACRVQLQGAPSEAWSDAAAQLPPAADPRADCSELHVTVDPRGADVTFVRRDGRRAQRRLAQPDELAPLLEALRAVAPSPDAETPPEAASPYAIPSPDRSGERDRALLGAVLVGVRGGGDNLLGPTFSALLLRRIRAWEAGLAVGVEPTYFDLGTDTNRGRPVLTTALSIARRQPLGPVAFLIGLRTGLGVIFARSVTVSSTEPTPAQTTEYELRAGLWLGVAAPRVAPARVRFRSELGFDFIYWQTLGSDPISDSSASGFVYFATPPWALSLALGAEFGGP